MIPRAAMAAALALLLLACSDGSDRRRAAAPPVTPTPEPVAPVPPDPDSVFAAAHRCVGITEATGLGLTELDGAFQWSDQDTPSHFRLQPSDLGSYLLLDADGYYLAAADGELARQEQLVSDTRIEDGVIVIEDRLVSEGEWELGALEDGQFRPAASAQWRLPRQPGPGRPAPGPHVFGP